MLQTVIIEDEPLVANDLRKMLGELQPDAHLQTVLTSVKAAKKWFGEHPEPDLLFVDIQLAGGVSFEIFAEINIQCPVIFTTAYNEYAIRAFKLNSIDYLLKPIDREELKQALDKFQRLRTDFPRPDQFVALLEDVRDAQATKKYKERFLVPSRNRMVPVGSESIAYFYRDEIIFLVTNDNQRHIAEFGTLEEMESLLNPKVFFRANRQYILHLGSVESFRNHVNGKLTAYLKPPLNPEVDISREKALAFRNWLADER
jgi:two-component system, LytTR family, response regulator